MGKSELTSGKAHLGVLMAMRRVCAERYRDGGWLPPGRQMAAEIGVNVITYRKALSRMVWEGFLESHPRHGHYVIPNRLRFHKVGLVLEDGSESPFLGGMDGCVSVIAPLVSRGLHTHLIQGRLDRIYESALIHGVDGLIWLIPSARTASQIAAIMAAGDLPLVAAHHAPDDSVRRTGVYIVEYDEVKQAHIKAETILSRGHRDVAYVGDYQFACDSGLVAALAASGIELTAELCVRNVSTEPGRLAAVVKRHGVTGVISEGSGLKAVRLFEELTAMPESKRPELMPFPFEGLQELRLQFPGVRIIELDIRRPGGLGGLAAKIMADHILTGKPLQSAKLAPGTGNQ